MSVDEMYGSAEIEHAISNPDVAHLTIDKDKVVSKNEIDGIEVETEEIEGGVEVELVVKEGHGIENPVHMCFGVTHGESLQRILMDIRIEKDAEVQFMSHCVFPGPEEVKHEMDADITIEEGAEYSYLEKHIHSDEGAVEVESTADVEVGEDARFKTDFELIQGRVGKLDIDYSANCQRESVLEMTSKVDGIEEDEIMINEEADLVGEGAKGVLTSRVAARDKTRAEIRNRLHATAPYARGHVDCKEIVQDDAEAEAIPIVKVNDPKAHVTHEAAIGSVDTKQLETLMARGLSEDEAVDLIIDGLLN